MRNSSHGPDRIMRSGFLCVLGWSTDGLWRFRLGLSWGERIFSDRIDRGWRCNHVLVVGSLFREVVTAVDLMRLYPMILPEKWMNPKIGKEVNRIASGSNNRLFLSSPAQKMSNIDQDKVQLKFMWKAITEFLWEPVLARPKWINCGFISNWNDDVLNLCELTDNRYSLGNIT